MQSFNVFLTKPKVQHAQNNGNCGICGDAYNDPVPRDNEDGGMYGRGIIVREYSIGQVIFYKKNFKHYFI